MSQRHIQAILDFPYPKNIRELKGFLGLTSYFRRFIKDYALKAKVLQALTHKNVEFEFDQKCIDAFEHLREELTKPPVLSWYNHAAITELHTDASSHGYGAILFQKQPSECMSPIAYFSMATSDAEKKYHSFELKTLAIVKAI